MLETFTTIAVDGGAASGKSTTARALAEKLKLMHVDTGSHYRAVTLRLLENAITLEEASVKKALAKMPLETALEGNRAIIQIDGVIAKASALRSEAVNKQVSQVAALPIVREYLFHYQRSQRDVARSLDFSGIVMEGRDIGSVILPDADLRVFLEADEATRSARRAAEGQQDAIAARDKMDSTRKTAPLTCPEGALKINTGEHSLEAVIHIILKHLVT